VEDLGTGDFLEVGRVVGGTVDGGDGGSPSDELDKLVVAGNLPPGTVGTSKGIAHGEGFAVGAHVHGTDGIEVEWWREGGVRAEGGRWIVVRLVNASRGDRGRGGDTR